MWRWSYRFGGKPVSRAALTGSLLLLAIGCSSRVLTNTPRSAIEQMLLSGAVDKALEKLQLPEIEGKKVFLDFANLKAYDAEYIKVATRARFAELGAVLMDKADAADLTAEVASGSVGTESKSAVVGMPAFPVPNSPVPFPEAPFHKSAEQTGIVKLLIFLHANGKFVAANHYYAKVDRAESFLLWWRSEQIDDIREGWEKADLKLEGQAERASPQEK